MSEVTFTQNSRAAVLTLTNENKLNALTTSMLSDIDRLLTDIEQDPSIRAVVLTGSGSKAFCCGADIAEWGKLTPAEFSRFWVRNGHRLFDRLARLCKPTIGAINGHAFGGGLELASCCDVRILSPRATLALPEAKIGIVPGWSGTHRLSRLFPESVLKEMALFCRRVSAERALALGFAAEIADNTLDMALQWVEELEAVSSQSNEYVKSMIHAAVGEDRGASIEALGSAVAAASDDCKEGVQAFLDKRAPNFGELK